MDGEAPIVISCDDCSMRHTDACDDCLVTFVLGRPAEAVVVDVNEARVVRGLTRVGLLPGSRHTRRAG